MDKSLLLLSGIPATGKSTFGRWLATEHGYLHIDIEKPGRHQELSLTSAWDACLPSGDVSDLIREFRLLSPKVILDWGFPPEWLNIVSGLKRGGADIWWFDGDRAKTREEFIKRRTVAVADLDLQMYKIERWWQDIIALFGRNRIDVIAPTGQRMSSEDIWRHINGGAASF